MGHMGLALVPADFQWLADARLKGAVVANMKARVEQSVREITMMRAFREGSKNVRVHEVGDAIEVSVEGSRAVGLERGIPAHQMVSQEGATVPIKTPNGLAFRKVTRLSLLMGKWRSKGELEGRGQVKQAIGRAMTGLAEAAVEAKGELTGQSIPRVRDILGVR
jgi:hypothetical protein